MFLPSALISPSAALLLACFSPAANRIFQTGDADGDKPFARRPHVVRAHRTRRTRTKMMAGQHSSESPTSWSPRKATNRVALAEVEPAGIAPPTCGEEAERRQPHDQDMQPSLSVPSIGCDIKYSRGAHLTGGGLNVVEINMGEPALGIPTSATFGFPKGLSSKNYFWPVGSNS